MKRIRMIGYDLDGTLLTEKKELTNRTKSILERIADTGAILVAATGRALSGIPEDVKNLRGADYFITANGAGIYRRRSAYLSKHMASDFRTGGIHEGASSEGTDEDIYELILERNIDRTRGLEIMRELAKLRVMPDPFIEGRCYMLGDKAYLVDDMDVTPQMKAYIRSSRTLIDDMETFLSDKDMQKITINFATDSSGERIDLDEVLEIVERYPEFNAVTGGINNIEISDSAATKGDAMMWLAERLGIDREQIVTFGDSENDITMIKMAGTGVAMGNALDEVKAAADAVTQTNDDDGVAIYLENICQE